MRGWIIYSSDAAKRNREYIELYFEAAKSRSAEIFLVELEHLALHYGENGLKFLYRGQELARPDFVINRTFDAYFSEIFEQAGIKAFNNSHVARIANDKRLSYNIAVSLGLPVIDTEIIFDHQAQSIHQSATTPFVLKSPFGSGGKDVYLVDPQSPSPIHDTYPQIKQKLASDIGKDLRVYVVGKEIIAAMLRTSQNNFKSNYSLGGKAEKYQLNNQEISYVQKLIDYFDFGMVGIDFIFHQNMPVFNEIEDCAGARMLYNATNINIADIYVSHIIKTIKNKN